MTTSRGLLIFSLLCSVAHAQPKKEIGALVIDGIADIPASIAERTLQYQNARVASAWDWEPSGKGLLIGTRFGNTTQAHFVRGPGQDRQQWTFYNDAVGGAVFDPQKRDAGFYFTMDKGGGEFYQIYWFDRATGRSTLLTDGSSRNESLLPSHRGGKIAYASTLRNKKDFDIYVRSDGDDKGKLVYQAQGQWNPISWSPDDSRLLLLRYVSITESYLHVLDLATGKLDEVNPQGGKKAIAYRSAEFAETGRDGDIFYVSDEDSEFQRLHAYNVATKQKIVLDPKAKWDVADFALSRDGKTLAFTLNEGGTSALYLAPPSRTAKAFTPKRIPLPVGTVSGLLFDRQSTRLAFTMAAASSPADAYALSLKTGRVDRYTESEVGGLDRARFVSPELVEYPSFDGRKIPAWVYRPRGASKDKPAPVIIDIHGGPESQSMAGFNATAQYYLGEVGAAWISPNVRGSSGYGKSYLGLDNGEKREDSVKDIGALLDWIATQPDLDKRRVAVVGGSYGGYMVLASLTHYSDRLRCGVDVVGISNFVTFLEKTEDYRKDLRRVEYGDERVPKMRAFLTQISPLTNAAKIKVPLLVVQGLNDPRVPAAEAEQIVKTLRAQNNKVGYLLAKDEGHGFRKKANRDYYINAMAHFLEEQLK